ncbi:MAG: hypothetical protein SWO11_21590 [Thermodesulfobacteriota bacterium]|nr:hypothetical protein [Thermodesulfobacteriota bacterium]
MRRGLEEAQSKSAGRRTGTGSEVWYIRDEWARDHKVLHPQRGVLYKSGVYALKALCLTPGGLYSVLKEVWLRYCGTAGKPGGKQRRQSSTLSHCNGLRHEQSCLTAVQESAEGIVGGSKQALFLCRMDELGTRPAIERAGDGNSRPNR